MILKIFDLIRYKNLLFIALIQMAMHELIFVPVLQKYGFTESMSGSFLWLLILATVLIAAGGYVLNDYFDLKIDRINRPGKQIIGSVISKQTAMFLHQALTFTGILAGLALAWFSRSFTLAFIFIVVPGLLWFYSASYKRQLLIGNLTVSFIAGLSVLVVSVFGLAFIKKQFGDLIYETPIPSEVQSWIGGFSVFAFLTTWIREIVKDVEDEFGDREMECRTMPIVWGIKRTKIFLYALILIEIALIFVVNFSHLAGDSLTLKYSVFGLIIPLLVVVYLLIRAKRPADYHQAATLVKFIMLIGVLYSFVFYFTIAKAYGLLLFNTFMIK